MSREKCGKGRYIPEYESGRLPIGTRCVVSGSSLQGELRKYGRDSAGIYAELRLDNGLIERFHPSCVRRDRS